MNFLNIPHTQDYIMGANFLEGAATARGVTEAMGWEGTLHISFPCIWSSKLCYLPEISEEKDGNKTENKQANDEQRKHMLFL